MSKVYLKEYLKILRYKRIDNYKNHYYMYKEISVFTTFSSLYRKYFWKLLKTLNVLNSVITILKELCPDINRRVYGKVLSSIYLFDVYRNLQILLNQRHLDF